MEPLLFFSIKIKAFPKHTCTDLIFTPNTSYSRTLHLAQQSGAEVMWRQSMFNTLDPMQQVSFAGLLASTVFWL